ncbi:hypothetical protein FHR32_005709 [Streptosporangium album]|uniref:Uncharacterized protein n=1 Tax=Streptosporangium album TaxID=47479 RepID=A0A7W7S0K6_9ACTN|nr:hypothetical protein [Streptosporangium album]
MFTEAERAALALTEEGTRLGVIVRNQGGSYEPGMFS